MPSIPSRACFHIGLIGIMVMLTILSLSVSCWLRACNRYTKRIFLLLCMFSVLELPLYFQLTISRSFSGLIVYSCHMITSILYFNTFSVVCFAWGDVLRAKNLEVLFEAKFRQSLRTSLVIANTLFIIFDFVMIYFCLSSASLDGYFDSNPHALFAGVDALKNVFMGMYVAHFGSNLRSRLSNYCGKVPGRSGGVMRTALVENSETLMRVSFKLLVLVGISILSFSLKIVALILWRRHVSPSEYEPPHVISSHDVLWWVLFELVPISLPAFGFLFTMGWPSKLIGRASMSFPDHSFPVVSQLHSVDSSVFSTSGDYDVSGLSSSALKILQQRYTLEDDCDDDCFQIMNRLSQISGDLVDVELERNSEFAQELRRSLMLQDIHNTGSKTSDRENEIESVTSSRASTSTIMSFIFPRTTESN